MFRPLAVITAVSLSLASCGNVHQPPTLRAQEECPSCGIVELPELPAQTFWGWNGSGRQAWTLSSELQTPLGQQVYVEPAAVPPHYQYESEVGVGCMQRRRVYNEYREPTFTATVKVIPPPALSTLTSTTTANAYCASRLGSSWRIVVADASIDTWDGTGFWAFGRQLVGNEW